MAFLPPSDTSGVFALLNVLSDPEQYNTKLDTLQKLSTDVQTQFDQLRQEQQDLDKDKARFTSELSSLDSKFAALDAKESSLVKRDLELSNKSDELDGRLGSIVTRENLCTAKEAELQRKSDLLSTTQLNLDARAEELIQRSKDFDKAFADLNAKISSLKAITG